VDRLRLPRWEKNRSTSAPHRITARSIHALTGFDLPVRSYPYGGSLNSHRIVAIDRTVARSKLIELLAFQKLARLPELGKAKSKPCAKTPYYEQIALTS
jgi:hypothetical protein